MVNESRNIKKIENINRKIKNSKFYRINKKENFMQKKVSIAIIVGIVIIVGLIGFQIYESTWQKSSVQDYYEKGCEEGCEGIRHVVYPENPQTLYGLQINKDKYLFGENVYVVVTDIPMNLKTQVLFYTPSGKQFYEISIDGERNSGFKQYFKPQLLMNRGLCDVSELTGEWTIMFENNPFEKLHFEMTGEYLPGMEQYYDPNTCGESITLPTDPSYMGPP